ncbi:MAG TPA: hypothetical protein VFK35_07545 [Candidatus Limnocylindrales bacterium]|nr:hypothetical protein [Candidatus Limnocylindrales bacterium]
MIVIVGSPLARPGDRGLHAAGLAADIGRVAARSGAAVEVVGRVGEDAAGDAVLLDLTAAGIGHVAVLRESGRLTPATPPPSGTAAPDGPDPGTVLLADDLDTEAEPAEETGLSMDAADLELALRYLPDYRVVIVADDLAAAALATVVAAAGWAGAHLIVLVAAGQPSTGLPTDATVLERPRHDPDGAFARVVGSYAVALDQGREPGAAFSEASGAGGWASVTN